MTQPSAEADARTLLGELEDALVSCRNEGDVVQRVAEERLSALIALLSVTAGELQKAKDAAAPLALRLQEIQRGIGERVNELYKDIQQAMGNPAIDVASALLFPGGTGFYTEGSPGEQSDRIELLAQLLEAGMLSKLPAEGKKHFGGKAREISKEILQDAEALRIPRARVALLERSLGVVIKSARLEIGNLKKRLSAEGIAGDVIRRIFAPKPKDKLA